MNDLPKGWTRTSLGKLCSPPQYGWTTSARKETPGKGKGPGLKLLRTTDITHGRLDWTSVPFCKQEPPDPAKYALASGDIVISRAGSVGFSYRIVDVEPAVFASYLIRFRPSEHLNGRYIAYFLQSPHYWRQIRSATSGITLANVNAKKLAAIELPLAPYAEQKRIVAAIEEQFSRLDAGIAVLEKVGRKLRQLRAAAHMRLDVAASSEAPPVEMSAVAEFIVDGDHNPPKRGIAGIPYLTAKHVKDGRISTKGATRVSQDDFDRLRRRYEPHAGDVIITCVGTLGEVAVVPDDLLFAADRNLAAVRPTTAVLPSYLAAILGAPKQRARLTAGSGSTAQPHLYLKDLRALPIAVPTVVTQERLLKELDALMSGVKRVRQEIDAQICASEALRSSILTAAFSGQLVAQDPADEPASVVIDGVEAEQQSAAHRKSARTTHHRRGVRT